MRDDRVRIDIAGYLARIGAGVRTNADADALRRLQVAHLEYVPFENLDIVMGRPISLAIPALEAKIVGARRGGFCYELNGLFAELLEGLGFPVTRLAAQTWSDETGWGPPFDHLVLRVDLERPWLVDVGFGDAFREPMPLFDGAEQADPTGATFGLTGDGKEWLVWKRSPGEDHRTPLFRFSEEPHQLADFGPTCRWQETDSPFFTAHRIVELMTPDGRRVLYDDRLITRAGAERQERSVSEAEVPDLLRESFGIEIGR